MSMKYIRLLAPMGLGFKKTLLFKWDWSVYFECNDGNGWYKGRRYVQGRRGARDFVRSRKSRPWIRNMKIQRRLASVAWEDYSDTFTYNAKGNGNGR